MWRDAVRRGIGGIRGGDGVGRSRGGGRRRRCFSAPGTHPARHHDHGDNGYKIGLTPEKKTGAIEKTKRRARKKSNNKLDVNYIKLTATAMTYYSYLRCPPNGTNPPTNCSGVVRFIVKQTPIFAPHTLFFKPASTAILPFHRL